MEGGTLYIVTSSSCSRRLYFEASRINNLAFAIKALAYHSPKSCHCFDFLMKDFFVVCRQGKFIVRRCWKTRRGCLSSLTSCRDSRCATTLVASHQSCHVLHLTYYSCIQSTSSMLWYHAIHSIMKPKISC